MSGQDFAPPRDTCYEDIDIGVKELVAVEAHGFFKPDVSDKLHN